MSNRAATNGAAAGGAGLPVFERNLLIAFLFGFLTICVLIGFSAHTVVVQEEHLVRGQALARRLELMDELLRRLLQGESSSRAYALTGQPVFLQEYTSARDKITLLLGELEGTRFEVQEQGARARQVAELVRRRIARLDELTEIRDSAGAQAAADHVGSGIGRAMMDDIRETSRAFTDTQDRLIEDINRRDLDLARQMQQLLVAFGILNVALMIVSLVLVRHEWRRSAAAMDELRRATDEITLLNNLSSSLQSCASVKEAKDMLQHFMERLFPEQSGALYIVRASRGVLESKAAWGSTGDWDTLLGTADCWALRRGQLHDYVADGINLPCQHVRTQVAGGYLCVPMMAEGEGIGMLHLRDLDRIGGPERNSLRERADRLALQIGPAIASLTLRELLHQQSIRDPLTGLYNRRYLEETVGRELLRAQRGKTGLGVIVADVDHFKQFNDTHGHQAGDEVLQTFASFLQDKVRGDDIACRYGGEEFAVILPGITRTMLQQRAEELRRGTMELHVRSRGAVLPTITASFGVALYPDDGDKWSDLLRAADSALYRAKHQGRNCVVLATATDQAAAAAATGIDVG